MSASGTFADTGERDEDARFTPESGLPWHVG